MIRKSSTIKYINGHSKLRDLQTSSSNDILVVRQKKNDISRKNVLFKNLGVCKSKIFQYLKVLDLS